jgi:radical SAM protein with 4Fe4S-binding SPASM domain
MKREKFVYEHPDIIRRYLEKGPCEHCQMANVCETTCGAYWNWWDARNTVLKKKYGME